MSVIDVKEDWRPQEVEETENGRAVERYYTVQCSDSATALRDARFAADLPRISDAYPDDFWCRVSSIRCKALTPTLIEAAVRYETIPGAPGAGADGDTSESNNPLNEPAEVSWGFAGTTEPVDLDRDGLPIVNSAGESFDTPLVKEFDDVVLTVVRNESTFAIGTAMYYKNTVNSDTFFGAEPGTAKVVNISASRADVRSGAEILYFYWKVTYEIHFRLDGWRRRVLDEGYREYLGVETDSESNYYGKPKYRQILDSEGNPVSKPVPLDGAGGVLNDGDDAVWLEFYLYDERPFAYLGLEE